jgi:hypothetical protein
MVLFAVGVGRLLRPGRAGLWGPRLLGLYGGAYISSGLFVADPVIGFPPGTLSHSTTWHGALEMASRSVSSAALIGASLVIASWFTAQGLRNWAWFSWGADPISIGAHALLVVAGADTSTKCLAFLVPGILMWVWVAALAVHLYRCGTAGCRSRPGAGADSSLITRRMNRDDNRCLEGDHRCRRAGHQVDSGQGPAIDQDLGFELMLACDSYPPDNELCGEFASPYARFMQLSQASLTSKSPQPSSRPSLVCPSTPSRPVKRYRLRNCHHPQSESA